MSLEVSPWVAAALSQRMSLIRHRTPTFPSPVWDFPLGPSLPKRKGCEGSLCTSPASVPLVPLKAPLLTQGWEKPVKCVIDVVFRDKRLVLMKEQCLQCIGSKADMERGITLSQVLFLPGAPHFCSHLPYLNPALRLLGYGCSLKCLAGFKSCWASSISPSNVLSLICLSLCNSFRSAGQSMSVVSKGSSLFLLCCSCGRTILCFPWVIS